MPSVHFETTCKDNRFWLTVGDTDISDGDPSVDQDLPPGQHVLHWHFTGNPGDTISVDITCDTSLGKVDKRPIPAGRTSAGGVKNFIVPGA